MPTISQTKRLLALERVRPVHATALVIYCESLSPEQQGAIAEAERLGRPVLIIRGTLPDLDPELSVIVEAGEGGSGSPKPDMTAIPRPDAWGR